MAIDLKRKPKDSVVRRQTNVSGYISGDHIVSSYTGARKHKIKTQPLPRNPKSALSGAERRYDLDAEDLSGSLSDFEFPETSKYPLYQADHVGPVSDQDHTSSVFMVLKTGESPKYFKSKSGEAWQQPDARGVMKPYRVTINNDKLCERENAARIVAEEMGVKDVSKAHLATVEGSYRGKRPFSEDGVIMDDVVSSVLIPSGHYKNIKSLSHAHDPNALVDPRRFGVNDSRVSGSTIPYEHMQSALKNGGMDIAFYDFAIGNMDRREGNVLIGSSEDGSSHKLAGFDHGLSIPAFTKLYSPDTKRTLDGLWGYATVDGKDIQASDTFKQKLLDPDTRGKLESRLKETDLTDTERTGVLERHDMLSSHLKSTGSLNGTDLLHLIKNNSLGYTAPISADTKWGKFAKVH